MVKSEWFVFRLAVLRLGTLHLVEKAMRRIAVPFRLIVEHLERLYMTVDRLGRELLVAWLIDDLINGVAFDFSFVFRLAGSTCNIFLTAFASCLVIVPSILSGPKYSTRIFK